MSACSPSSGEMGRESGIGRSCKTERKKNMLKLAEMQTFSIKNLNLRQDSTGKPCLDFELFCMHNM